MNSNPLWYVAGALILIGSIGAMLSLYAAHQDNPKSDFKEECESKGSRILVQEMTGDGRRYACIPGYWIKE